MYLCGMKRTLTKKYCFQQAKLYSSRSELSTKDLAVYNKLRVNGWLDDACGKTKLVNSWSFDECKKLASSCRTRNEFKTKFSGAWRASHYHEWIDEICQHMDVVGSIKKRCVYVYEFTDGSIYVGLTVDLNKRHLTHKIKGPVSIKLKELGYEVKPKIVSEGYIDVQSAAKLEKGLITKYKEKGIKVLNTLKGGQLGVTPEELFTLQIVRERVKKYNSRWEFQQKDMRAYKWAQSRKLLDTVCENMNSLHKTWDKDELRIFVKNCETYTNFSQNFGAEYQYAQKKGWIEYVTQDIIHTKRKEYSDEELIQTGVSMGDKNWCKISHSTYEIARTRGLLPKIYEILKTKGIQKQKKEMKKVKVNDKIFESISDAARVLGVSNPTIKYRIQSSNFPDYSFL